MERGYAPSKRDIQSGGSSSERTVPGNMEEAHYNTMSEQEKRAKLSQAYGRSLMSALQFSHLQPSSSSMNPTSMFPSRHLPPTSDDESSEQSNPFPIELRRNRDGRPTPETQKWKGPTHGRVNPPKPGHIVGSTSPVSPHTKDELHRRIMLAGMRALATDNPTLQAQLLIGQSNVNPCVNLHNMPTLVGNDNSSVPDGSGFLKYRAPNTDSFVFDQKAGYKFDSTTGLHYDANSGLFINLALRTFLRWDPLLSTYLRVELVAPISQNSGRGTGLPTESIQRHATDGLLGAKELLNPANPSNTLPAVQDSFMSEIWQRMRILAEETIGGIIHNPGEAMNQSRCSDDAKMVGEESPDSDESDGNRRVRRKRSAGTLSRSSSGTSTSQSIEYRKSRKRSRRSRSSDARRSYSKGRTRSSSRNWRQSRRRRNRSRGRRSHSSRSRISSISSTREWRSTSRGARRSHSRGRSISRSRGRRSTSRGARRSQSRGRTISRSRGRRSTSRGARRHHSRGRTISRSGRRKSTSRGARSHSRGRTISRSRGRRSISRGARRRHSRGRRSISRAARRSRSKGRKRSISRSLSRSRGDRSRSRGARRSRTSSRKSHSKRRSHSRGFWRSRCRGRKSHSREARRSTRSGSPGHRIHPKLMDLHVEPPINVIKENRKAKARNRSPSVSPKRQNLSSTDGQKIGDPDRSPPKSKKEKPDQDDSDDLSEFDFLKETLDDDDESAVTHGYEESHAHDESILDGKSHQSKETLERDNSISLGELPKTEESVERVESISASKSPKLEETLEGDDSISGGKSPKSKETLERDKSISVSKSPELKATRECDNSISGGKSPKLKETLERDKSISFSKSTEFKKTLECDESISEGKSPKSKETLQRDKSISEGKSPKSKEDRIVNIDDVLGHLFTNDGDSFNNIILVAPVPLQDDSKNGKDLKGQIGDPRDVLKVQVFNKGTGSPCHYMLIFFNTTDAAALWYKSNNGVVILNGDGHSKMRGYLHFVETGNWNCSNCMSGNFLMRTLCVKCYQAKDGGYSPVSIAKEPTKWVGISKLKSCFPTTESVIKSLPSLCTFNIQSIQMITEPRSLPLGLCVFEVQSEGEGTRLLVFFQQQGRAAIYVTMNEKHNDDNKANTDSNSDENRNITTTPQLTDDTLGKRSNEDPLAPLFVNETPKNILLVAPIPMSKSHKKPKSELSLIESYLRKSLEDNGVEYNNVTHCTDKNVGAPCSFGSITFPNAETAADWRAKHNKFLTLNISGWGLPTSGNTEPSWKAFLHFTADNWDCKNCLRTNFSFRSLCHNCFFHREGNLSGPIRKSTITTRWVATSQLTTWFTGDECIVAELKKLMMDMNLTKIDVLRDPKCPVFPLGCVFETESLGESLRLHEFLLRTGRFSLFVTKNQRFNEFTVTNLTSDDNIPQITPLAESDDFTQPAVINNPDSTNTPNKIEAGDQPLPEVSETSNLSVLGISEPVPEKYCNNYLLWWSQDLVRYSDILDHFFVHNSITRVSPAQTIFVGPLDSSRACSNIKATAFKMILTGKLKEDSLPSTVVSVHDGAKLGAPCTFGLVSFNTAHDAEGWYNKHKGGLILPRPQPLQQTHNPTLPCTMADEFFKTFVYYGKPNWLCKSCNKLSFGLRSYCITCLTPKEPGPAILMFSRTPTKCVFIRGFRRNTATEEILFANHPFLKDSNIVLSVKILKEESGIPLGACILETNNIEHAQLIFDHFRKKRRRGQMVHYGTLSQSVHGGVKVMPCGGTTELTDACSTSDNNIPVMTVTETGKFIQRALVSHSDSNNSPSIKSETCAKPLSKVLDISDFSVADISEPDNGWFKNYLLWWSRDLVRYSDILNHLFVHNPMTRVSPGKTIFVGPLNNSLHLRNVKGSVLKKLLADKLETDNIPFDLISIHEGPRTGAPCTYSLVCFNTAHDAEAWHDKHKCGLILPKPQPCQKTLKSAFSSPSGDKEFFKTFVYYCKPNWSCRRCDTFNFGLKSYCVTCLKPKEPGPEILRFSDSPTKCVCIVGFRRRYATKELLFADYPSLKNNSRVLSVSIVEEESGIPLGACILETSNIEDGQLWFNIFHNVRKTRHITHYGIWSPSIPKGVKVVSCDDTIKMEVTGIDSTSCNYISQTTSMGVDKFRQPADVPNQDPFKSPFKIEMSDQPLLVDSDASNLSVTHISNPMLDRSAERRERYNRIRHISEPVPNECCKNYLLWWSRDLVTYSDILNRIFVPRTHLSCRQQTIFVGPLTNSLYNYTEASSLKEILTDKLQRDSQPFKDISIHEGPALGAPCTYGLVSFKKDVHAKACHDRYKRGLILPSPQPFLKTRQPTILSTSGENEAFKTFVHYCSPNWLCKNCNKFNFGLRSYCITCLTHKKLGPPILTFSETPTNCVCIRLFKTWSVTEDLLLAYYPSLKEYSNLFSAKTLKEKSGIPLGTCILETKNTEDAQLLFNNLAKTQRQNVIRYGILPSDVAMELEEMSGKDVESEVSGTDSTSGNNTYPKIGADCNESMQPAGVNYETKPLPAVPETSSLSVADISEPMPDKDCTNNYLLWWSQVLVRYSDILHHLFVQNPMTRVSPGQTIFVGPLGRSHSIPIAWELQLENILTDKLDQDNRPFEVISVHGGFAVGAPCTFGLVCFKTVSDAEAWHDKHKGGLILPCPQRYQKTGKRQVSSTSAENGFFKTFVYHCKPNWSCRSCNKLNFGLRSYCLTCLTPKEPGPRILKFSVTPTKCVCIVGFRKRYVNKEQLFAKYPSMKSNNKVLNVRIVEEESGIPLGACLLETSDIEAAEHWFKFFFKMRNARRAVFYGILSQSIPVGVKLVGYDDTIESDDTGTDSTSGKHITETTDTPTSKMLMLSTVPENSIYSVLDISEPVPDEYSEKYLLWWSQDMARYSDILDHLFVHSPMTRVSPGQTVFVGPLLNLMNTANANYNADKTNSVLQKILMEKLKQDSLPFTFVRIHDGPRTGAPCTYGLVSFNTAHDAEAWYNKHRGGLILPSPRPLQQTRGTTLPFTLPENGLFKTFVHYCKPNWRCRGCSKVNFGLRSYCFACTAHKEPGPAVIIFSDTSPNNCVCIRGFQSWSSSDKLLFSHYPFLKNHKSLFSVKIFKEKSGIPFGTCILETTNIEDAQLLFDQLCKTEGRKVLGYGVLLQNVPVGVKLVTYDNTIECEVNAIDSTSGNDTSQTAVTESDELTQPTVVDDPDTNDTPFQSGTGFNPSLTVSKTSKNVLVEVGEMSSSGDTLLESSNVQETFDSKCMPDVHVELNTDYVEKKNWEDVESQVYESISGPNTVQLCALPNESCLDSESQNLKTIPMDKCETRVSREEETPEAESTSEKLITTKSCLNSESSDPKSIPMDTSQAETSLDQISCRAEIDAALEVFASPRELCLSESVDSRNILIDRSDPKSLQESETCNAEVDLPVEMLPPLCATEPQVPNRILDAFEVEAFPKHETSANAVPDPSDASNTSYCCDGQLLATSGHEARLTPDYGELLSDGVCDDLKDSTHDGDSLEDPSSEYASLADQNAAHPASAFVVVAPLTPTPLVNPTKYVQAQISKNLTKDSAEFTDLFLRSPLESGAPWHYYVVHFASPDAAKTWLEKRGRQMKLKQSARVKKDYTVHLYFGKEDWVCACGITNYFERTFCHDCFKFKTGEGFSSIMQSRIPSLWVAIRPAPAKNVELYLKALMGNLQKDGLTFVTEPTFHSDPGIKGGDCYAYGVYIFKNSTLEQSEKLFSWFSVKHRAVFVTPYIPPPTE